MRVLQYPWIVVSRLKNKETSEDGIDYLSDIYAIRASLSSHGTNVPEIEKFFSSDVSPQSSKLKKFTEHIQQSVRKGDKGMVIVTNDIEELDKYLMSLCYVWALTLNKSAVQVETRLLAKACKDMQSSFPNDSEEIFLKHRAMSLLVLKMFAPVTGKSNTELFPEIEPLIVQRFSEVSGAYTIMVLHHQILPDNMNDEFMTKLQTSSMDYIKKVYSFPVSGSISKKAGYLVMPFFNETPQSIGVLR